ncbi:hypothetical protein L3X38_045523 [Prunus dulcis]|uniref:Uncharacterized protein n=1 Tax=Prunus dulcis TaxID=3755 RepID=A0AAD4USG2_PRUDU|nr:hypothetical protein L3X38_045523 [Prunus dulcis]
MESLEELYLDGSAVRELPLVIKNLKRLSFAKSSTSRDGIGIDIGWGLDCLFGSSDDNEPGSDSSDDDDEPISKRFKKV